MRLWAWISEASSSWSNKKSLRSKVERTQPLAEYWMNTASSSGLRSSSLQKTSISSWSRRPSADLSHFYAGTGRVTTWWCPVGIIKHLVILVEMSPGRGLKHTGRSGQCWSSAEVSAPHCSSSYHRGFCQPDLGKHGSKWHTPLRNHQMLPCTITWMQQGLILRTQCWTGKQF